MSNESIATKELPEDLFEVESIPDAARARFASALERFAAEHQSLKDSPDGYYQQLLAQAGPMIEYLRSDKPLDTIRTVHAGKEMRTLVLPYKHDVSNVMSFLDMLGTRFVGDMSVIYLDTGWPRVYGTCTVPDEDLKGQGLNSHRIRTAAKYIYDTHKLQLRSSTDFADEKSRDTWKGMEKEGRAEWIPNEKRYLYIPEASV